MLLSEEHRIRACRDKGLFKEIDGFCYCTKNLSNCVNYLIRQLFRIHTKLKKAENLETWEYASRRNAGSGSPFTGRRLRMQLTLPPSRDVRIPRDIWTVHMGGGGW